MPSADGIGGFAWTVDRIERSYDTSGIDVVLGFVCSRPGRALKLQRYSGRPGQRDIHTDQFYDYRTNVASYPAWQQWLR